MTYENNAVKLLEKYQSCSRIHNSQGDSLPLQYRDEAVYWLRELGLPTKKLEAYRRSDINAIFNGDFAFTSELPNDSLLLEKRSGKSFGGCEIPNLKSYRALLRNDRFVPELSSASEEYPEGVFVGSLADFRRLYPDRIAPIENVYGHFTERDMDGMVALNALLVRDVFLVYIPSGVVLERPLQLILSMFADRDLLATPRILIYLEEASEANLIFSDDMGDDQKYVSCRVIETYVGKGARLSIYGVEYSRGNHYALSTLVARQMEESKVAIGTYTLGNGFIRNNYYSSFRGERAELRLDGLAIGSKGFRVDNQTRVEHLVPDCHTDELFKYLLKEDALGSFAGRIYIAQGAEKTLAYQQNRNLLLSSEAQAFAKPFLEIYADDVHCSHGMTTGQLDEEALFYMRQRGIPEENARAMLCVAFAKDVLERIAIPELQQVLLQNVERDLYGNSYEEKSGF